MSYSQALASREYVVRQGAMRQLYSEGTGSLNVEEQSDPYQGVPRVWVLLNPETSQLRAGHSATTGVTIVITKNQVDLPDARATLSLKVEAALHTAALSPAFVLENVRAVFGLNVSETAEIFGITRQTVYQWMKLSDMDLVRSHENRDRIKHLYSAAQSWQTLPLLKGRWLHALLPTGNSIFDILKSPECDVDTLLAAYNVLAASSIDRRREEGERTTKAAAALANAFAGLGAGRNARKGAR